MDVIKKITHNAGFIFIGGIAQKGLQFLVFPALAAFLGEEKLGIYSLVGAVVFVFTFFTDMGLSPVTIREVAKDKAGASLFFSRVLSLRMTLACMLYPILQLAVWVVGYGEEVRLLFALCGLSLFVNAFNGAYESVFVGFEEMRKVVFVRTVSAFLSVGLGVGALALGYGLWGIMPIMLLVDVATSLFWFWGPSRALIRLSPTWDVAAWKTMLGHSLPFASIAFLQQINRSLNVFLLSRLPGPVAGLEAVGRYSPASAVARFPVPLIGSIRQAILPSIASGEHRTEVMAEILEWSFKAIFWLFLTPMVIAGLFYADRVILTLFPGFEETVAVFQILAVAYSLQAVTVAVTSFLAASKDINRFIPMAGASLLVNLVVALALIPSMSYVGAAYAVLSSKVFNLIGAIVVCRRNYGGEIFPVKRYVEPVLVLIILLLGQWALFQSSQPELLKQALGIVLMLGVMAAMIVRSRRLFRQRRRTAEADASA